MAPAGAAELRLAAPRAEQLSQWAGLAALRSRGALCDVALRSSEGGRFAAHGVVLGLISPKLQKDLEAGFNTLARPLEITVDASSDAIKAILDFIYEGSARVGPHAAPHVLRVARQWEFASLRDNLACMLLENLTPEIATGLFALGEPFGEQLGAAARAFILSHFAECAKSKAFGRWSSAVLNHILRSDDLVVENEETALASLLQWCRQGQGREGACAAALPSIRWPLLPLPVLDALVEDAKDDGELEAAMAARSSEARQIHQGRADDRAAAQALKMRKAYPGWWAGPGCTLRGVSVLAGRGAAGKAGGAELRARAVRPHEGTVLFLDAASEPGCVFQWFLRAHCGRSIAGRGSALTGPGAEFEDIADIWSGPDDAFYVLDRDAECVVRVCQGEAEIVGKGKLKLDRPCALAVGADLSVYVLEAGGARVLRFSGGEATTVAGGAEPGQSAHELNAGPTGRIFLTRKGQLYVADTENHRVLRWDPGAKEGLVVAGGNGCGAGHDQLNHPGGIWALEDGTLFVADTGNHRVVRWREGGSAGVVAAGGCEPGEALQQLREPLDVAVEAATGALLVADAGNMRVVRWASPAVPEELLALLKRRKTGAAGRSPPEKGE